MAVGSKKIVTVHRDKHGLWETRQCGFCKEKPCLTNPPQSFECSSKGREQFQQTQNNPILKKILMRFHTKGYQRNSLATGWEERLLLPLRKTQIENWRQDMKQKIIVTFQGGEQASARSPCGGIDGGTGFTEYFQWVPEEGSMQWSPQVSMWYQALWGK